MKNVPPEAENFCTMTHCYRSDFETYLTMFDGGYVDFDDEQHARSTTEFTDDEKRLLEVCFSVIEQMRKDREDELTEERRRVMYECNMEYDELHEQFDELTEKLRRYEDFYEDIRSSVNCITRAREKGN